MSVRITPFMALGLQYGPLIQGWRGDIVVRTVHGGKTYKVPAAVVVDLCEVGVMIAWLGDDPTGVIIPWGEIVSIEQAASSA